VLIVAGFTPYLKNSDQAVLRAGLEVANRAPAVIAAAGAALSEQQKELGAAVLDVGAGTTGLAVYEEGDLSHIAILPIGSANITHDIAIGLKVDVETAERLKVEKGICVFKGADKKSSWLVRTIKRRERYFLKDWFPASFKGAWRKFLSSPTKN
jgi:Actin-like ATPase involved in cell division